MRCHDLFLANSCEATRSVARGKTTCEPHQTLACETHHILTDERFLKMSTILVVLLILFLVGALPHWGHSRNWGYGPSGGLGLIVLILVVLLLMGRI
jgi:hypothetical protein